MGEEFMAVIRKKHIVWAVLSILTVALVLWIAWGNSVVGTTEYTIKSERIPESFTGFRIAQISDLHNTDNNREIIKKLKKTDCDIIVITGDMIDSRFTNTARAVEFCEEAVKIAPVYYVTGNHEARIKDDYNILKTEIQALGVIVLENETAEITQNGESITIIGLHDTGFDFNTGIDYTLSEVMPDNESYKILLAHRPEYFDKYNNVDLIFSGHAHGGQVRLPFIGGLFAPGQGLLPKYDAGVYIEGGKTMVVSRGLGNSLFPFRVNNNPEIVVVTLERGE